MPTDQANFFNGVWAKLNPHEFNRKGKSELRVKWVAYNQNFRRQKIKY